MIVYQDRGTVKSRLTQLNNAAWAAKTAGDYDHFCELRRQYLLLQAEHYSQLRAERVRKGAAGG